MKKENQTKTAGGLVIMGVAWKPKLYKLITKRAKKQKCSKGKVVNDIVEEFFNFPS